MEAVTIEEPSSTITENSEISKTVGTKSEPIPTNLENDEVAYPDPSTEIDRTLLVKGFKPFWGDKNFTKFMEKQQLDYERARTFKKSPKFWVTFPTLEKKETARQQLDGLKVEGKKLKCLEPESDGNWLQQTGKRKHESRDDEPRKRRKIEPSELKTPAEVLTQWHDKEYPRQCLMKLRTVRKAMNKFMQNLERNTPFKYGWIKRNTVSNPVGCVASPVLEAYRNKDTFTMGLNSEGEKMVGCRLGKTQDGVMEIGSVQECIHLHSVSKFYVAKTQEMIRASNLEVYDRFTHKGVWRSLLCRTAHQNSQILVCVTVQLKDVENKQEVLDLMKRTYTSTIDEVKAKFGFTLVGVMVQDFSGLSDVVPMNHEFETLYGEAYLTEKVCGLMFRISFQSFFQVNVPQAERMYQIAGEWARVADCKGKKTVLLDVCCGTGTIGLSLASHVTQVVGLEIIPEAVEDANHNKELNGIKNAEFLVGKAEETIQEALDKYQDHEVVVIVDPPRSGLHGKVLKALRLNSRIKHFVYISCNPTTCAEDCVKLCRGTTNRFGGVPFKPVKSIALDMFPHTPHTEMIVLLERIDPTVDTITRHEKKKKKWRGKRRN